MVALERTTERWMRPTEWHGHNQDRAIVDWAERSAAHTCVLIAACVAAAWVMSLGAGGSKSVAPHLFYLPVLVAAARFGHRGALVVALGAGVVAGPLLPVDVTTGEVQSTVNWLARTGAFVVVGQVMAALHTRSLAEVQRRINEQRDRAWLQAALDRHEFVPAFQPIVDLREERVVGVEALARWRRSDTELLAPAEFIDAAERTGLIGPIGLAILDQACQQLARWRDAGTTGSGAISMSVNLSARQLDDPGLVDDVAAVLDRTGVDASALTLEVTETALAADPATARQRLAELRQLGVRIALDDFGVGNSSLSTLHQFPIDVLKIDRSFIAALEDHARGPAIVAAIVALADALGIDPPVAEGIETEHQLQQAARLGCGYGQGFLLARPMLAESVDRIVRSGQLAARGQP